MNLVAGDTSFANRINIIRGVDYLYLKLVYLGNETYKLL